MILEIDLFVDYELGINRKILKEEYSYWKHIHYAQFYNQFEIWQYP